MRFFSMLIALGTLAVAAHPWACYHGNPQHTGRSQFAVGDSLSEVWTYAAGGDVSGSAVVDDAGRVYFGARDVHVYCLNPDGSLGWEADLSQHGTSIYFSAPALDDVGNVYITTNRRLVKIDTTGTVAWWFPDHSAWSISHSPTIGIDGNVYFACYSESLYAVTPEGTLDWAKALVLDANSAPAVGLDGRVYMATTRGTAGWKLFAFEPDGREAWSVDLADEADFASPAVGPDSTIYVGASRYLYAVSPEGTVKWRDSLSAAINSCVAIDDTTLYVTAGSRLYSVAVDSGIRWSKYLGGSNYSAPAVDANGSVFVGAAGSPAMMYVVGPDSSVRWSRTMPDDVWASPALGADGRVYVGCMDGTFFAFQGPGAGIESGPSPVPPRFVVRPNPTTGIVSLSANGTVPTQSVRVFSVSGAEVLNRVSSGRVDLRGLPSGAYVIEMRGGAVVHREKVVLR